MSITLVVPLAVATELRSAATAEVETAGVLLARMVTTPAGDVRLLARRVHWVPADAYLERKSDRLSISSSGYVHALADAEQDGSIAIWLHSHPGNGSSPRPSRHDRVVDEQIADLFRLRAETDYYAALVISHHHGQLRFAGHLESAAERADIDRLWITGSRLHLAHNATHDSSPIPDEFDRNIRAFGGDIQRVLGDLSVAVVGAGGTGSSVAEQLTRLGVRRLHLLDPDELSDSNVTRVYGSARGDVGRAKVEVLAAHLRRIAPDAQITTTQGMITSEPIARTMLDADVVFGCTDDNAGRLVLSRIASYLLTPVIDCGVLLSSGPSGQLQGIDGRVTVLAPGAACLVCRGRIDLQRAAAEMMTPEEHERLAGEGYAPALAGVEPAVVTYTTQVAAAAVTELLERLVHYGPEPAPTEILLRLHEREVSTNDALPRSGHYCDPQARKLGSASRWRSRSASHTSARSAKLLCGVRTLVLPNAGRSSSRSLRTSRAWAAVRVVTLTCRIRPSASRIRVSAITRLPRRRTAIAP